jgi:hypothetical protein
MAETTRPTVPTARSTAPQVPPLSRAVQVAAGLCLVLAGVLNGGAQYAGHLLTGDMEFSDQIRWAAEHPVAHQVEQTALLASVLFLPLAILALAHLTRWRSPRLTAVATVLALWGMWGFHNILALGYTAGTVAPTTLGTESAVALNESFLSDAGVWAVALVPHLAGSFLGMLLLSVAGWRSRVLPRGALLLLVGFLLWDFLGAPLGPLEGHLLLMVALVWLGVVVARLPRSAWCGTMPGLSPREARPRPY